MKRVPWELEEMVAMVDLYYRDKNGKVDKLIDELSELSRKLNKRAEILNIDHDYKYRNLNGMKIIFQNVRYADTNRVCSGTILSDGSHVPYMPLIRKDLSFNCKNMEGSNFQIIHTLHYPTVFTVCSDISVHCVLLLLVFI